MLDLYGKEIKREQMVQYIGSMSQVAGARAFQYTHGKAKGVAGVEVRTGSGLEFTVLPDRGLDIADAQYKGMPLAWISKNGIVKPEFFEWNEFGFLRSFAGGLLTTCGLTQVGFPCQDGEEYLGLHGRVSNTPADQYNTEEYWDNNDYIIKVKGQLRESRLYGENLVLRREISTRLGEKKLILLDEVENEGFTPSPLMLLYHINFGYPLVSEKAKLYTQAKDIRPFNDAAKNQMEPYDLFHQPTKDYEHRVYLHTMPENQDLVYAGIVNEELGLGVYLAFSSRQLPYINQWKQLGQQDYVVGIEPTNCYVEGRAEARKHGRLQMIEPGQKQWFGFELGILEGKKEIEAFVQKFIRK